MPDAAAVVHAVVTSPASRYGPAFAGAVAGFSRSLARELARSATTVNAVGGYEGSVDDAALLAVATRWLLQPEAGFVTGQSWGTAGAPAPRPRPAGPAILRQGRGALVSGGGGGIGGAITRRLHAAGWQVVIGHARREPAAAVAGELDPTGATCRLVPLDLSDPASISRAAAAVAGLAPRLDAVVLCGGWNRTVRFAESPAAQWRETLAINLTGPCRLLDALPEPGAHGRVVVGIGSESGRIGDGGRSVYAAAKAGLAAHLSSLNGAPAGLRAATVSPGPTETPMLRQTHPDPEAAARGVERLRRLVPLGRLGMPDEVAAAVALLCSAEGRPLGGEVVSVGGGVTMV